MIKHSKIFSAHEGIALVLSVLILANLMMIALIVSDVILRIGKTSSAIGESETAYFAAESAIEEAVYKIEKEYDASDLGTESALSTGKLTNPKITWQRYIRPVTTTPIVCVDSNGITTTYTTLASISEPDTKSCIYPESCISDNCVPLTLTKSNPLHIKLRGSKSFELDYNIEVPAELGFYPSGVDLNWDNRTPGSLIIFDSLGQVVTPTSELPSKESIYIVDNAPNFRIRFVNDSSLPATYTIYPHEASWWKVLPVGIEIVAKGYYNGQKERIIVLNKKFWKIY